MTSPRRLTKGFLNTPTNIRTKDYAIELVRDARPVRPSVSPFCLGAITFGADLGLGVGQASRIPKRSLRATLNRAELRQNRCQSADSGDNTYRAADNFSQVLGNYTMKFGAELHAGQVHATLKELNRLHNPSHHTTPPMKGSLKPGVPVSMRPA